MSKKISIFGAGNVGSSLAFSLLNRLDLRELVLVDVNPGLAKGRALDLEDTRGILKFRTKITGTNKYSVIKDSEIIVITAGVARKSGMTRLDLLKINGDIARSISKAIKQYAPKSLVIVVTNPLDLIVNIVSRATGFRRGRVIGMGTSLDTSRLLNIIHNSTGISCSDIEAFVWGLHSKDMIVSTERIRIKGESLRKYIKAKDLAAIKKRVQLRGAEIVSHLKNGSAHFAPGLSVCNLIEAIISDRGRIIPVSLPLKGEYGLKGICLGVPCLITKNGASKIIELTLSKLERSELAKTKKILSNV